MSTELSVTELETKDVLDLKNELVRSLSLTAKHLAYCASIWRELERRGSIDVTLGVVGVSAIDCVRAPGF
ncbi:MAG: hypothetical protein ACJAWL_003620 [Motiliproteus sp.]|jgi:hypothetical protein